MINSISAPGLIFQICKLENFLFMCFSHDCNGLFSITEFDTLIFQSGQFHVVLFILSVPQKLLFHRALVNSCK